MKKSQAKSTSDSKQPKTRNTVTTQSNAKAKTIVMGKTNTTTHTNGNIHHISSDLLPQWMKKERSNVLTFPFGVSVPKSTDMMDVKDAKLLSPCIYYWMQRDVRTVDNWALLYAEYLAKRYHVPLRVVYTLPPPPSSSSSSSSLSQEIPPKVYDMNLTHRHGMFLIHGLQHVAEEFAERNVPFDVLFPSSRSDVGQCLCNHVTGLKTSYHFQAASSHFFLSTVALAVVCDMSPLRHVRSWMEDQAAPLLAHHSIPLLQIDAHNIIPVWYASDKREIGARTLRPKIHRHLDSFLTHFPVFQGNAHMDLDSCHTSNIQEPPKNTISPNTKMRTKTNGTSIPKVHNWETCIQYLSMDNHVQLPSSYQAGTQAAMKRFSQFCQEGLRLFDTQRNDPNFHSSICSNLSPWVNYGHVSFQRLALEVRALQKYPNGTAAYLEEGIVRRELSDNFCYYTKDHYDDMSGAMDWARLTLQDHESDPRDYTYTLQEFERGETHDDLWNAAQLQLVREGKMHGFLRMYWAKKILEWTESPHIALRTGQYLNDRYALDGNDPNGFVGVGWSVMGVHDMGWKERPIFGKIRFMNYEGCKRKFKVDSFVAKYPGALENALKARKGKSMLTGSKRKASEK